TAVALLGVLLTAASAQAQAVEAVAEGAHVRPAATGGAVGEGHGDGLVAEVATGGWVADPVFGSGFGFLGFGHCGGLVRTSGASCVRRYLWNRVVMIWAAEAATGTQISQVTRLILASRLLMRASSWLKRESNLFSMRSRAFCSLS